MAFIAMGQAKDALAICSKGMDWTHLECTAIAERALGHDEASTRSLARLHAKVGDTFPYVFAQIYAQWHRPADALHWLGKARDQRDSGLTLITFDPMIDPVRQDPGFKAVEQSLALLQ